MAPEDKPIARELLPIARDAQSMGALLEHPFVLNSCATQVQPIWQNTVRIETDEGAIGSGFFLQDCLIATNAHVVDRAHTCSYRFLDGPFFETRSAILVAIDYPHDLALLQPLDEDRLGSGIALGPPPAPGQPVGVCGFPLGCETPRVLQGCVSGYECQSIEGTDVTVVVLQVPVNRGCSGGPVCDEQGRLVGVVRAINNPIRGGSPPQPMSREAEQVLEAIAGRLIATDGFGFALDPTDVGNLIASYRMVKSRKSIEKYAPTARKLQRAHFVQLQHSAVCAKKRPADCSPIGVFHYSPESRSVSLGWLNRTQVGLSADESWIRLFEELAPGGGHFLLRGYDVLQYKQKYRGWVVPVTLKLV